MDYKKEIINRINGLSGSRSPYEIFSDWVKLMALAIQNASFPLGMIHCGKNGKNNTLKS